ncbi:hypothetical protein K1T71_005343 [Dendrolimus kikuchii]|uniref:Uncharacterized protein n=1 Tax=Dendrolimus kikuchii TaxID=765133 RepID=A0ACC1D738_9NEOP|nr:hypothetical protein K1T71_005343 [Dendrolimus kikuchii]
MKLSSELKSKRTILDEFLPIALTKTHLQIKVGLISFGERALLHAGAVNGEPQYES